jgi:Fe-S-cluster containining protein
VLDEDIARIARHLGISKEDFRKNYLEDVLVFNTKLWRMKKEKKGKPYGTCLFLSKTKGCTIHRIKPFHCRISTCNEYGEDIQQWFQLNYAVNKDDAASVREWAICAKAHPVIKGGALEEIVPDKNKLAKILNYEVI